MGCAQIDHTPYGLVRSRGAPAVGVACLAPVKREITFPLLTGIICISGSMGSPQLWGAQIDTPYGLVRSPRADHTPYGLVRSPYGLVRSPRAPAVGVACLAPVKREITFPLLTEYAVSPGVWVHPSYGVRTDRPHSVWSCALSEGTCGGRCLPCTSQEGNNLSPLD